MKFKEKLLAYKGELILSRNSTKAQKVCKTLLCNEADQPFLYKALPNKEYLEIVCYWITNNPHDDVRTEFNQVLRDCDLSNFCLTEADLENVTPFEDLKDEVDLSKEQREQIYECITNECKPKARYIGHFLISNTITSAIHTDESKVEIKLERIMKEVRENHSPSWACLEALLNTIGLKQTVLNIKKDIISKGNKNSRSTSSSSKSKLESSSARTSTKMDSIDQCDGSVGKEITTDHDEVVMQKRMAYYLVNERFLGNRDKGKKFCEHLTNYSSNVNLFFGDQVTQYDFPVLELVTKYFSNNTKTIDEMFKDLNDAFEKSGEVGIKLKKEELKRHPFENLDTKSEIDFSERPQRRPVFYKVSSKCSDVGRYIANFLLDYPDISTIVRDNQKVDKRLKEILEKWFMSSSYNTWPYLRALLRFLKYEELAEEIDKEAVAKNGIR